MSEVISLFKSWITGVCSPYVVSLCNFAYYVVCKNYVGSVYVGVLSKSGLCVFRELCPVSFLVLGESPLVLL